MNKNAKKWVKALESGKYQQTSNRLKDGESYCCLGVACDLFAQSPEGRALDAYWKWDEFLVYNKLTGTFFCHKVVLPPAVQTWLGMVTEIGDLAGPEYRGQSLVMLNDMKKPFTEIAEIIKNHEGELFGEIA